ncbi:MAG: PEP-CTERM sorting domain-containing protein [Planctomycetes bacterium]|nr:PEP-CTERM sorting domain-containing protein [Planctomycetota bacterium]
MLNTGIRVLVVALLSTMLSSAVDAAFLTIDDLTEGQITFNHDANWEFGVTSNGVPFGPFSGGSTTVPGEVGTFTGSWFVISGGSPDPGSGIIYVVDPGTNIVSDIILAIWSTIVNPGFDTATITVVLVSSPEGGNLGPLPATFAGLGVQETDGFFGIVGSFRDSTTSNLVSIPSNLGMHFGSHVPEPSTWLLGTLAAVGIIGARRRRK